MQLDQRKYYIRGILFPAVIVVLIHFGVYVVQENQKTADYQSGFSGADFVLVMLNAIFVLMLSSPILLANLAAKSKIARVLFWFLPAGSWLLYLCWKSLASLLNNDHVDDAFYTLSNSVPYMAGLIWAYTRFNKDLEILNGTLPELEVITKEDRKIPESHTPPPQSPMG